MDSYILRDGRILYRVVAYLGDGATIIDGWAMAWPGTAAHAEHLRTAQPLPGEDEPHTRAWIDAIAASTPPHMRGS